MRAASSTGSPAACFVLRPRAGDASTFKIVNNLLAGANLAAGAEALALRRTRRASTSRVFATSSTRAPARSWIFADRVERALDRRLAPRAAVKLLAKDVGDRRSTLAATARRRRAVHASSRARAFAAAVAAGHAEDDDAVLSCAARWTLAKPSASDRSASVARCAAALLTSRAPSCRRRRTARPAPGSGAAIQWTDPRLQQLVLDPVLRQPPRRVREDQLGHLVEERGAFRRIGQRARRVVAACRTPASWKRAWFSWPAFGPYRSCMKFSASG